MFSFTDEKREIERLKDRIATERIQLAVEARQLLPTARKGVVVGSAMMLANKYSYLLRPIIFGLVRRSIAKQGKRRWFKIIGLLGAGYAAWRFFGPDDEGGEI